MRLRSLMATTALAGAATFGAVAPAEAAPSTASDNVGVQSVALAVFYQHRNYAGSTLTSRQDYGCDTNSDMDFQLDSFPSGWNDRVSSWKGYSNCGTRIYEFTNFSGASYGVVTSTAYVGDAMNDRASSYRHY